MFHQTFRCSTAVLCASDTYAELSTPDINVQCVKTMFMFKLKNSRNSKVKENGIFMCCSILQFLTFLVGYT